MLVPGLIVSVVMVFVARPLSVFISLAPFRSYTAKDKLFVSWVGLRGAVPIIFAILCRANGVPHSDIIFNVVFMCTLVSLVVQGTTLPVVARWLGVSEPPTEQSRIENFDIEFPEEIKSATTEIEIIPEVLRGGSRLMDLGLPERTLAIMVKRGDLFFVPTGKTHLLPSDRLMVISDNNAELQQTLTTLGFRPPEPEQETPESAIGEIIAKVNKNKKKRQSHGKRGKH